MHKTFSLRNIWSFLVCPFFLSISLLVFFLRVWVCVQLCIILKWKSDALFPRRDKEKKYVVENLQMFAKLTEQQQRQVFIICFFFAMSHTTTWVQCFIICKFSTSRFLSFFCVFVSSFWATKEKRQYYVTVSHAFFTKQNSQEAYTAFWRGHRKKIRKAGIEDEQEKLLL